jgi:hypothetical protein
MKITVLHTSMKYYKGENPLKIATLIFVIVAVMNATAQFNFERTYGTIETEEPNAVHQTTGNGYIIAGYQQIGSNSSDVYFIKTDEYGDTVWTRTYSRTWSDVGESVIETSDGYVLVGFTVMQTGPSVSNIYLIKTDFDGDTVWTNTIGEADDELAADIRQTADGGFVICGNIDDKWGNVAYYLVKTNSEGDSVWSKKYGLASVEKAYAKSVQQTSDKGYIIAGHVDDYTYGTGTGYIYIVKTDSIGDTLWTKKYDWPGYDQAYSIDIVPEGGYIIGGYTSSFGAGASDFLLLKIDEQGDSLWLKTYGGIANERAFTMHITADGGYALSGYTQSYGAGFFDFYLVKTDGNGDTVWTRTYGDTHQEMAYDMEQTSDGGFVLTGYTYSFSAGSRPDIYLVKTDANGLITSISDPENRPVSGYHLNQNYPNPFNPLTTITYIIDSETDVNLSVYNIEGRLIRTLVAERQSAGSKSISWSGRDQSGNPAASGIYFAVFKTHTYSSSIKMILLR